ncbi:uncharacterized protein Z518_08484 [Rhinocladiella mackenziei CBS 650.93]|uniref:Rhinocladiella mackenziei CBS 650.93 unplaced genomic scaffold supercont1.6, whole genome shotgun sequence n=1 Tax=Rhinocladiella mackenziei CBS 650.93 TaxID=1442369 RepID=A0A0D2GWF8_9EURO|nr:uncharacterized protein Z518_08484 [Rhinocladiella mackenziei CBS 650.93]KIX02543.1 hypothetical protein Z518_08484 [Rhinocladiella mackenziei CBS 650.93]
MPEPLSTLSPAKQNSRSSPIKLDFFQKPDSTLMTDPLKSPPAMSAVAVVQTTAIDTTNIHRSIMDHPISPPVPSSPPSSPRKAFSPIKYRLHDESRFDNSPPGSLAEPTVRFTEGLTRAMDNMQKEVHTDSLDESVVHHTPHDGISASPDRARRSNSLSQDDLDDMTLTLSLDDKTSHDETVGDLSTISAIPTDMTRFANSHHSPSKPHREPWSPSKQLRGSIITSTPGTAQRPLRLLSTSRRSTSSNEDDEATPRGPRHSNDSPTDLLNFTGQTNILIPPPNSAPRTMRRSPSGRGGFPIKVNPSPAHRSQASVDRERASGRSPQKQHQAALGDRNVPATPAGQRHSLSGASTGLGVDLLDIDLEPMATPRSIPTITPRELETLRSELQSRISGLEATLSGKEAEVMALKRAITDAEVRVGKTSEELRTERASRAELEQAKSDLERRSREMEEVLREIKQNVFLEEREKEKLRRQTEEADRKVEEQEVRILELQASLDTLRSERVRSTPSPDKTNGPATPGVSADIDFAVKDATEKVARELHALYKSKHERKVSDLKVSYEKRWIKQVEQLRAELKASQDEVIRLQTEKEATMSGVIPGQSEALSKMEGQIEELRRWNEETVAEKKMIEAEAAGLRSQVDSLTADTESLRKEVEQERVEKGDLVAQVDLFLAMSAQQDEQRATQPQHQPVSPPRSEDGNGRPNSASAIASPNKFRNSMNGGKEGGGTTGISARPRPMSMLQKPTAGKYSGIPAPGSGLKAPSAKAPGYSGRSCGIMEGIARMGAGGR